MKRFISFDTIHKSVFGRTVLTACVALCLGFLCCAGSLIPEAHATAPMAASESCVEFIKSVEGFSAEPYYDYGQYTIGYGTMCPTDRFFNYKSNGISRQEADTLLRNELADISDTLNQKFISKYGLSLTQNQFDALVSFSFNIGPGWVTYDSTLRNAILRNANDADMAYAFSLYCTAGGKYLPGLVSRRLCEANMYLNGVYSKNLSNAFGYVYYDANGGSVEYRVQGYLCSSNSAPAADASRPGDTFLGWYTDLTGGERVTALSSGLTGKTLFARWQSSQDTGEQNTVSRTVKVTGDAVNVRTGPGTNYAVVKRVYRNESVTVSHVTHLTNMKWGKISGGWICLDYTDYDKAAENTAPETGGTPSVSIPVPSGPSTWDEEDADWDTTPDSSSAITGTVNVNDFLIVRSGPGTTYASVGFLFKDNTVRILEQKTSGGRNWGKTENGWVCMDYIVTGGSTVQKPQAQPEQTPSTPSEKVEVKGTITADALRIRSAAGTGGKILGFYYRNDAVTVSEKTRVGSVTWGKTDLGWISMDYVSENITGSTPSAPTTEATWGTVTADCLRIRKNPGTDQPITGFLYTGDTVSVTETRVVNALTWGKVSTGWICMQYVD